MKKKNIVHIIGAGFAGSEAAYFLANHGYQVYLYEMRDKMMTPAHKTSFFAEPVCSNSFKSKSLSNAHGLLKKELSFFNSLIIKTAYQSSVPAGDALAVDREQFALAVTEQIKNHSDIQIINDEITTCQEWLDQNEPVIIASGPLTSPALSEYLQEKTDKHTLYFFDAAAPIVDGQSLNYNKLFFQSRYDKGGKDYLNAPFNQEEYYHFVREIINAEKVTPADFENTRIFEGCQPIEVLAERGLETLAFGPMKPVGLMDPATGKEPYAVIQLRTENINQSMYNLVGFQTRLKWPEQQRIFRMIPGLENAEFLRYGVMHRNTYLNLPAIINPDNYTLQHQPNLYFSGQITGVEGYIESAASGLITAYSLLSGKNGYNIYFPENTILGALQRYTITPNKNYQPMAANFGLINHEVYLPNGKRLKGKDKKNRLSEEAIESIQVFIKENDLLLR